MTGHKKYIQFSGNMVQRLVLLVGAILRIFNKQVKRRNEIFPTFPRDVSSSAKGNSASFFFFLLYIYFLI